MDLKAIENELKNSGTADTEGMKFVMKDGKVLAGASEFTGSKGRRPSVWGTYDETGNISWLLSESAIEKRVAVNRKVVKTTIGTHVSEDEFVEISRLSDILGISRSKFCRDALQQKVKELNAKLNF